MIDNELIEKCEKSLAESFKKIDDVSLYNQEKVLNAFRKNQIALRHFCGTTGYAYGDEGRDTLNKLVADVFGAESAICSANIVSGTHAISLCLYGVLRPGDLCLSITGEPYDTLQEVVSKEGGGSLKDFNIEFASIPLKNGKIDKEKIKESFARKMPKMVYLQRSRGYEWRDAFSVEQIKEAVDYVRSEGFDGCIMLDNCYGEFVEKTEPTEVGVNLMAGSMIKNPGGGIAPTGGYVVGDEKYVDLVGKRLTAPSIGREVGSNYSGYQLYYQGLFLAPHVVGQALKGSMLFGKVLTELGYEVSPSIDKIPSDIIRAIKFNDRNAMVSFVQGIQIYSPIDSFALPMPWDMPGYEDQVIMAAGCFVQGASIELSADGPVRPPYIAYFQGGLTYEHCKITLKNLEL